MRAVVQRVSSAAVRVDGQIVGQVDGSANPTGQALAVLLGVTHDDGPAQRDVLVRKLTGLRILDGERSALDVGAPVLVVSQFTLYADTRKGRRPSWNQAAPAEVAEPVVADFARAVAEAGLQVATGSFGAHMDISLECDGPITILLEA